LRGFYLPARLDTCAEAFFKHYSSPRRESVLGTKEMDPTSLIHPKDLVLDLNNHARAGIFRPESDAGLFLACFITTS
jgi:hypothetical protein